MEFWNLLARTAIVAAASSLLQPSSDCKISVAHLTAATREGSNLAMGMALGSAVAALVPLPPEVGSAVLL